MYSPNSIKPKFHLARHVMSRHDTLSGLCILAQGQVVTWRDVSNTARHARHDTHDTCLLRAHVQQRTQDTRKCGAHSVTSLAVNSSPNVLQ